MSFFSNIGIKLVISVIIAGISILSQLSDNQDTLLADKVVVLGKSPSEVYKVLTALEEYATWYPGIVKTLPNDNSKHLSLGKIYKQTISYFFDLGETTSSLIITGNQSPSYFEFISDTILQHKDAIYISEHTANRTKVNWKIYSRRKSLLFKYIFAPFCKFYYSQTLREALFTLQFMLK